MPSRYPSGKYAEPLPHLGDMGGDDYDTQYEMKFEGEDVRLKTPLDMVKEFRTAMSQERSAGRSFKLMEEEWEEFLSAYSAVNELKELADLVYVSFGYAEALGWDLDEALRRVHKNNMERCVWPDGSVRKREDGKVMKYPEAGEVELEDLV